MAPEIMAGDAPTEDSDVYSLCAVIWEILHGMSCLHFKFIIGIIVI